MNEIEAVKPVPLYKALNFYDFTLGSYAGSPDGAGTVSIESGGATLNLTGNFRKQIAFAYTITPDTVLEFDFQSTAEGKAQAIGFDNTQVQQR